jgi:hypothetical protein
VDRQRHFAARYFAAFAVLREGGATATATVAVIEGGAVSGNDQVW